MENTTLSKVLTAGCLILSRTLPSAMFSVSFLSSIGVAQTQMSSQTQTSAQQLPPFQMNILKTQFLQYVSSVSTLDPSKIAAGTQSIDPTLIKDLSQESTTEQEKRILRAWGEDIDAGTLSKKIDRLVLQAKASDTPIAKQLENLTAAQTEYAKATLKASIEAVVKLRGFTEDSRGTVYNEWLVLSEMMTQKIDMKKDYSEAEFLQTEQAEILVDGPESFARRDKFIGDALESINIMTWSVYDDVTGKALVDLLLQKKRDNPKLNIRVLVDGQVAALGGHNAELARLEAKDPLNKNSSNSLENPIKIIRWRSKNHTYMGQHRKMITVDNEHLIAGGINFGDAYSHKNSDPHVPRWRDTDVYLKGAAAIEGNNLFAKIWNEQVHEQEKPSTWIMPEPTFQAPTSASAISKSDRSGFQFKIIDNDPRTHREGSTIMLTVLSAIRAAKKQIDIENAYIILFPALKNEIQRALDRGVKIRILTNSSESVDEPAVSIPILRSVAELADLRSQANGSPAEVYVRKGTTLHSKILMIDALDTYIMSYNLHPRSERLEGEMAIVVRDETFTQNMHAQFTADIHPSLATRINSSSRAELPIKNDPTALPVLRIFFDTL
ncbi:MAG: phosphatidylserine/phosphatidylglycerophosphate/cardiolipin synthase family protein [Bdellovibrionaceae bacterium]|nr:phosphatidylserine/phosphatidylglycerophosphate/cardiolipin synthase family protein [Pseudobdellovibrionaceae bacterium]